MPDAKSALRRQIEKMKEIQNAAKLAAVNRILATNAAEERKSSTEDQPSRRESEPT